MIPFYRLKFLLLILEWTLKNNTFICIHTDSLSSIQILNKHDCNSKYINTIKTDLASNKKYFTLSWVKARASNTFNEISDQLAKDATKSGFFL